MTLKIENLTKYYQQLQALKEINLEAEKGVLGLVGPNGSGKTSLMRIIATLLTPTSGSVSWNSIDTKIQGDKLRQILGYLPQYYGLEPNYTARNFLRYIAILKRLPPSVTERRISEVLEIVNLESVADKKIRTMSGGMKQRIGIAQALLNDPQLLILDEPTVGLDPEERLRFRIFLSNLTANRLIILSTHIISDVEEIADRLVIMKAGQVLEDSTLTKLIQKSVNKVWSVEVDLQTAAQLQAHFKISGLSANDSPTKDKVAIRILSSERPHEDAIAVSPTLEEAYLLTVNRV